ncbi:MAG: VOC family protein [Flammeovirgaceae bacterium]
MKSIIQTPTGDLQKSLNFYQTLGYTVLSENNPVLVSDGKAVIEINPDRFARAGVKLYASSWKEVVAQLAAITSIVEIEKGYLLSDSSSTWIYLMETDDIPSFNLSDVKPAVTGNFAGISLEVIDMKKAQEFWETLGLQQTMGGVEQGWLAMANADGFAVSFMKPNVCPHLFFNPSMTYFNGKENVAIIEKIRDLNIPITEEITHFNQEGIVDNIIIRDPGGYGFFLFSD